MGELSGIEPPRLNWLAADLPTEFASFRQYCELIFRGPFADKDEAARVTYILLWVGQEGLRMYNTWDLSDSDSKKVDVIWGRFRALIEQKANFRLSRFNPPICVRVSRRIHDEMQDTGGKVSIPRRHRS